MRSSSPPTIYRTGGWHLHLASTVRDELRDGASTTPRDGASTSPYDRASTSPHDSGEASGRGATHNAEITLDLTPVAAPAMLSANEVSRHAVRLVAIDPTTDHVGVHPFSALPSLLRTGDLVVVNDAATLPGSLFGRTAAGEDFELRLAEPIGEPRRVPEGEVEGQVQGRARGESESIDGTTLVGVMFGAGDWRTRTEHRGAPPPLPLGSLVRLGNMIARVTRVQGRRVTLVADEILDVRGMPHEVTSPGAVWQAVYAAGVPVQYAHRTEQLDLWTVQTAYAARPWAAEMPSAGRPLTWDVILGLKRAGIAIASLTHAAGLGSIGDEAADRELPWPERYEIPERTARAIAETRAVGGRVIAIGTTVIRALEASGGKPGAGVATLRLDPSYRPEVVDGLVSGLHVPGESHFELLRAFASHARLSRALGVAARAGMSGHELGDACLIVPRH